MPDDRRTESFAGEHRIAEIAARCGNIYCRAKLSPATQLTAAAKHWVGLSLEEIVAALEAHLDSCRHLYLSGSGDGCFWMVERDMRNALESKYPRPRVEEPERPQRSRSRIRKLHNASGFPDAYVEGEAARPIRDHQASPVERSSGLGGYETAGDPLGIEDDA